MENAQFPLAAIGLLYLLHSIRLTPRFSRWHIRTKMLAVPSQPWAAGAWIRLGLIFAAGAAAPGLLRSAPVLGVLLFGGAIGLTAAAGLLERADRRSAAAEGLRLLRRLAEATEAGADFFDALGAAGEALDNGRLRTAVDAALNGYAQRKILAECLRPLGRVDAVLAGLAADVRRIGWEASAELAEAVGLVRAAAVRRWERGRGRRVRIDWLRRWLPGLRVFAAGVVVGTAVLGQGILPAHGGVAVRWVTARSEAGGTASQGRRLLRTHSTVPFRVPGAVDVRRGRGLLPEILPAAGPAFVPFEDRVLGRRAVERHSFCSVGTGVPGGQVNVREGPGMEGRVLFYVAEGALLEVLRERGDFASGTWREIETADERTGWIHAPLCELSDG